MADSNDLIPPSALVVEYKSSLIFIGVVGIVITIPVIILLAFIDALQNIIAIIAFGSWLIVSIFMLRKAYLPSALIITDEGIKVKNKNYIAWDSVTEFYIKSIVWDDFEEQRLIINTTNKDFELDIADLEVERKSLDRWITFYRRRKSMRIFTVISRRI